MAKYGLDVAGSTIFLSATFAGVVYFLGARDPVEDTDAIRIGAAVVAAVVVALLVAFVYWEGRVPAFLRRRRR